MVSRAQALIMVTAVILLTSAGVVTTHLSAEQQRPDIIVLSINSLRADHLSCYGHERNTTPNICAIAEDGTRYEEAVAQHYWTTPSETSILTGLYPGAHGVTLKPTLGQISPLPGTIQTLPEVLSDHGYQTTARVPIDQWVFPEDSDLLQGFNTVHNQTGIRTIVNSIINDTSPAPAFTYAHTKNLHRPYQIPPPFRDRYTRPYNGSLTRFVTDGWMEYNTLYNTSYRNGSYVVDTGTETIPLTGQDLSYVRDRYDTVVRLIDHDIGRLIDALKDEGRYEDSLIVITAPHGETLAGPHDAGFGHTGTYPPVLHVPLIIKPPGNTAPRTISGQVELVDLYPTLLDLVGLQPPEMVQGQARPPSGGTAEHAFSAQERVQTADWIYRGETSSRGPALYRRDSPAAGTERTDQRDQYPEVADRLRSQLRDRQEQDAVVYSMLRSTDDTER